MYWPRCSNYLGLYFYLTTSEHTSSRRWHQESGTFGEISPTQLLVITLQKHNRFGRFFSPKHFVDEVRNRHPPGIPVQPLFKCRACRCHQFGVTLVVSIDTGNEISVFRTARTQWKHEAVFSLSDDAWDATCTGCDHRQTKRACFGEDHRHTIVAGG